MDGWTNERMVERLNDLRGVGGGWIDARMEGGTMNEWMDG